MTLLILDPDLADPAATEAAEVMALARAAAARGDRAMVLAARSFAGPVPEGLHIQPFFAHRGDATLHDDPVTGAFDDFTALNDSLAEELARIPRVETRAADAVIVPRAGPNQLVGLAAWMKGFDPLEAPTFLIRFADPPGADDPLRALFWRLGFRALDREGPEVMLGAAGRSAAAAYSALAGRPIPALPAAICPEPAARPARATRRAAIVVPHGAGAAAEALARALSAANPEWHFVLTGPGAVFAGAAPANLRVAEGPRDPSGPVLPAGADLLLALPGAERDMAAPLWEALALGLPMLLPQGGWAAREAAQWGEFLGGYPASASTEQLVRHFAGAANRLDELGGLAQDIATRFRAENGAAALLDVLGRRWASRMAAAALLVRERETAVDLATLRMEGWHRLEEEGGQPFRWTAKEPEIAFDWPFRMPWQLRLRLRGHQGDAQLRGAEAWCGGRRLDLAVVHDAGGLVMRIDGPPGDPASSLVTLRIVLPTTARVAEDPRELGVMVSAITLRAAAAVPASAPQPEAPVATVRAAPDPAGGWSVAGVLSGEVVADPAVPLVLVLRIAAPGGPSSARALRLHLDGAPLRLDLTAEPGQVWIGRAAVPAVLGGRGGLVQHWDLVAAADEGAAPRLLEIRASRAAEAPTTLTTTGGRLGAPTTSEAPPAGARRQKWWLGGG